MRIVTVVAAALFTGGGLIAADGAHASVTRYDLNIPRQPLDTALNDLAQQTGLQVGRFSDAVKGDVVVGPLTGNYSAEQALKTLLIPTRLTYRTLNDRAIIVLRPEDVAQIPSSIALAGSRGNENSSSARDVEGQARPRSEDSAQTNDHKSLWSRLRLAQTSRGSSQSMGSVGPQDEQASQKTPVVLQEVIVTARFRSENVQRVGAAISPLSSDIIEQEGIKDFGDIVRRTPGLASTDRGPNTNEVLLRGISNQTTESVSDISAVGPLVSQFLDDVPFASATASQRDVNLFDFDRVEVLRGPQPTFFGEGSVGGTIRYVSADPKLSGDAIHDSVVHLGFSATKNGGINGSGNIATTLGLVPDVFAIRAVFNWRNDDGFIDNPLRHADNTNTFNSLGGRVVALYRPDDALTVRFAAHLSRDRTGDLSFVDVGSDPSSLVLNTHVGGSTRDNVNLYSLKADYKAGPITISSVTGYYRRDRETTGYDPANSGFFSTYLGSPINILIDNPLADRTWTQEFRFVSNFDGPLNFTSGLFYKNKTSTVVSALTSPDGTFGPFQEVPGDAIFSSSTTYETRQYSGFLEATFSATRRLRFIAGARYVHEKIDSVVNQYLSIGGVTPPIATIDFAQFLPVSGLPTTYSFVLSKVLPRAAIEFDLSHEALLYVSVATGVRNGNLNTAVSAFQAAGGGTAAFDADAFANLIVFHDDQVHTYELGLKTGSFDDRLTTNLATYFTHYEDPQIYTATPFVLITNGPDANIKGLELETSFHALRSLNLFGNASYTDARYTGSALLIPALAPTITADVQKGNRLVNVPKWAFATGVDVDYPLGNFELIGHLSYEYVGDRFSTAENFVSTDLPSTGIVNARLGVQTSRWSAVGYVANATNRIEPQAIGATGGLAFVNSAGRLDAPVNSVAVNRPRTIGVDFTFRY